MNKQTFLLSLFVFGIVLSLFYITHNYGGETNLLAYSRRFMNNNPYPKPIPVRRIETTILTTTILTTTQIINPTNSGQNVSSSSQEWKFQQMGKVLLGYSAYYDDISWGTPKIRIVGIDDVLNRTEIVECLFYGENGENTGTTPGASKLTEDPYVSIHVHTLAFIICEVDYETTLLPTYVAIKGNYSTVKIRITYPPPSPSDDGGYKYKVASCIQPLHSGFEHPMDILEWIEFHILMGVEHFTFYNYSIGPITSQVLRSYPTQVTVLPWNLPYESKGIPVYGQLISASECAYRHRNVAKYIMTFDTDEFLVPINYTNYADFLDYVWKETEEQGKNQIGSIQFTTKLSFDNWPRNNFSYLTDKGDNDRELMNKIKLISRTKFLSGYQTKFVHRPNRIIEAGVHFAQRTINGTTAAIADSKDFGYYFHFRACDSYFHQPNDILANKATCTNHTGSEDDTLSKQVGPVLVARILDKVHELNLEQELLKH